jgi:hypothetical protein
MSKEDLVLEEATPLNSEKLNEFFTSIPLRGEIDIKIQREQSFFSFYQRIGLDYKTYIIKDQEDIVGTASFLFKNLSFQNRVLKLAQACDLRISSHRKVILSWAKLFHPILEQLRESEKCDGFITSINQTETQAMNAFIRPKLKRPHQPQYSLARSYNLVSVHGFYPFRNPVNKNIKVRLYQASDKKDLIEYLNTVCKKIDFIPQELTQSPENYINKSLLYSWSQFLIAFDANEKIIGCVQPISSTLLQDYLPQDYSSQSHNLRQFLKVAEWLRFGRRLARPFSRSQKHETLNFRLLHFLSASHPEVFNALIRACYKTSSQNEFLMYAYEISDYKKRPPKGSIFSEIPYGLYSIETSDRDFLPELSLLNTTPVWLDFIWF